MFGPPLSATFSERFSFPKDVITEAIQVYRAEYNAGGIFECELFPGIVECLDELRGMGYDLVVTSSKHEVACKRIAEHFGITDHFYDMVGSTGDVSRETKTEVLEAFFSEHPDHKKEEAILIGDTMFDAEGAKNVGIDFIAVTYGYGTMESLKATDALTFIDSPEGIVRYFKELPGNN